MGKNTTRLTILLQLFCILLMCSCKDQVKENSKIHDGYTISGKTTTNDTKVYLINNKDQKIDSVRIKESSFSLKGKIKEAGLFYLQTNKANKKHLIILENTSYHALFNKEQIMIIGGNLNNKLNNYLFSKNNYYKENLNFYEQLVAKDINLRTYLNNIDSLRKVEKQNFSNFIINNESNILSSIILKQRKLSSKDTNALKKLLTTSKNKNLLNNLNTLTENLKIQEAEKKVLRRKPAPLFSGINLSGSKSSLASIMKGKKAFLIDFWASWCPPCRRSSPKIINLYNKYHKKGFDVLTVSEDRSVADWKNGIYTDEIENWHHIYDDYNRISSLYKVTALPHLVLIDENGKIIKNKISIKDLEQQLDKIFTE